MRERGKREIQMDPHREVFWDTMQNQTSLIKRRIPLISNVISNQDVVNNDIITTDRFIDKILLDNISVDKQENVFYLIWI